ncbi:hypothetical protein GCM10010517_38140 [Streptosporangium fragile]|uniref:PepSY domain-containing protein n=1 Tax=Streptosporangium fragile TaxID=46186 RepID=A0ABP6IHM4_9ACTN
MRKTTKLTLATIGLLAVVGGGGAAAFAGEMTPTPTPEVSEADVKVQRDAAIKIAQDKIPGARLVKAEFDGDEAPASWEIELRQGDVEHDLDIDATTGAILEQDRETETAGDRADDTGSDDADDQNGQDDSGAQDDADDQNDSGQNTPGQNSSDARDDADDQNDSDDQGDD